MFLFVCYFFIPERVFFFKKVKIEKHAVDDKSMYKIPVGDKHSGINHMFESTHELHTKHAVASEIPCLHISIEEKHLCRLRPNQFMINETVHEISNNVAF